MEDRKLFNSNTIFLTAIICLATLLLSLQLRQRGGAATSELDVEAIKAHAQELQNNQLFELAAAEYGRLSESKGLSDQQRANLSFIRGKLYLEKIHNYEQALACFLKAKQKDEAKKLTKEIDRLIVEALEKMGRRSDAQHKMAATTSLKNRPAAEGQVVAKIGEQEITINELNDVIGKLPDYIQETLNTPQQRLKFLEQYVTGTLMTQAALRRGLDKDQKVRQEIADFEKQILAESIYNKEVREKTKLSDAEIREHFQANKDKYKTFPWVQAAHIMVKTQAEAEQLLKRLNKGEDFTAMAAQYSLDEKTKQQGGQLGVVDDGGEIPGFGVQPQIKEQLFAAKAGDFIGPLELNGNFHIFRILYRNEEQEADFAKVKPRVINDIKQMKEEKVFHEFLRELQQAQKVVIYDDLFR